MNGCNLLSGVAVSPFCCLARWVGSPALSKVSKVIMALAWPPGPVARQFQASRAARCTVDKQYV
jgi:hypothetical protein